MIEIKKIVSGPIETNTYVVKGGNLAVIIDAEAAIDDIKEIVGEAEVAGVILTHGHFDHMGGLYEILEHYDTKCYLSAKAIDKLYDPMLNCSQFVGPPFISKVSKDDLVEIKEGDTLDFLLSPIKIIETPGHTDCCICVVIENAVFTGDTLFSDGCGRTDLPTSSQSAIKDSLSRLKREYAGFELYSGHGNSGTIKK